MRRALPRVALFVGRGYIKQCFARCQGLLAYFLISEHSSALARARADAVLHGQPQILHRERIRLCVDYSFQWMLAAMVAWRAFARGGASSTRLGGWAAPVNLLLTFLGQR